jgi:hypothetical protein
MYLLEYKYKWQLSPRSYVKLNSIDEIIDWLSRFENHTLEDYIEINNINEIRIILKNSTIVFWIQLYRTEKVLDCEVCKRWNDFEIVLITNDYPIGKLNSIKDICTFLKMIIGIGEE